MIPVKKSNLNQRTGISSTASSVVWDGPDIPCINLCTGDHILDVIYKLATELCNLVDAQVNITELDYLCVTPTTEGQTLFNTVQNIITKVCDIQDQVDAIVIPTCDCNPDITVESCIYDNHEIITMPLQDYVEGIATKVCSINTILDAQVASLDALQVSFDSLYSYVYSLENSGGSYEALSIISQCASYNTPGISVPIVTAFENFESAFCSLSSVVGSTSALTTAISKECTNLSADIQLADTQEIMSSLSGWTEGADTIAESLGNLWLTTCDIRAAIKDIQSKLAVTCMPISPIDFTMSDNTNTTATFTWTEPSVVGYETPTSYTLNIIRTSDSAILKTETIVAPADTKTVDITSTSILEAVDYKVTLSATYSCGDSLPSIITTAVKSCEVTMKVDLVIEDVSSSPITCDTDPYFEKTSKIAAVLKDLNGNSIINNTGVPIVVNVSNLYHSCELISSPMLEQYSLTIPTSQLSSAWLNFISDTYTNCGGTCSNTTRTDNAIVSTSDCHVGIGVVTDNRA